LTAEIYAPLCHGHAAHHVAVIEKVTMANTGTAAKTEEGTTKDRRTEMEKRVE